jgi:hypothetical protein
VSPSAWTVLLGTDAVLKLTAHADSVEQAAGNAPLLNGFPDHPAVTKFTPTGSSCMNQVERWFGLLTDKLIRRGVHTSVKALEHDITAWIDTWNKNPRPFTWTKTADEILNSLADYLTKVGTNSQKTE